MWKKHSTVNPLTVECSIMINFLSRIIPDPLSDSEMNFSLVGCSLFCGVQGGAKGVRDPTDRWGSVEFLTCEKYSLSCHPTRVRKDEAEPQVDSLSSEPSEHLRVPLRQGNM